MIDKQRGNIIKMDRHRSPQFCVCVAEKKAGKAGVSGGRVSQDTLVKTPLSRHPCHDTLVPTRESWSLGGWCLARLPCLGGWSLETRPLCQLVATGHAKLLSQGVSCANYIGAFVGYFSCVCRALFACCPGGVLCQLYRSCVACARVSGLRL